MGMSNIRENSRGDNIKGPLTPEIERLLVTLARLISVEQGGRSQVAKG